MDCYKTVSVESSTGVVVRPVICERCVAGSGSQFTWPSAYVMAAYVLSNSNFFVGKAVLELGAGTGLPSIVAALCGAKQVLATDRAEEPRTVATLKESFYRSNVTSVCTALPLDWNNPPQDIPTVDIVLGADIFYLSSDFEAIICLLARFVAANPAVKIISTFQERSTSKPLLPLLYSFGLKAESVPTQSFLHCAHREGFVLLQRYVEDYDGDHNDSTDANEHVERGASTAGFATVSTENAGDTFMKQRPLPNFDNIELFVISLSCE